MASIQGVYVALFGRPADPAGLAFFDAATSGGANLTAIGDLSASAEYQARFTGMSNTQIINAIYMSLFGHAADAAGLAFFVAALNTGSQSINTIAINILDGAQGTDKTLVDKKIAAADLFTAEIDTAVEVGNYTGTAAAAKGVAFLSAVTATSPVVDKAAAAAAVADIPNTDTAGTVGVSINLAAATDVVSTTSADPAFKSTANDDTITAPLYAATNVIDAGAGTDKVMATVGAGVTVATDGLKNVEQLFAKATAGVTVDVANAKELTQVWNNASGFALTVDKMMLSTTAGVKGADNGSVFNFAGATGPSDTATLALDGATNAAGTTDIALIETLNISNTGSSKVDLKIADTTKIVVSGTGAVEAVFTTATKVSDIDASGLAGSLKSDVTTLQALASVKGGTLGDMITVDVDSNTVALKVDGGAGADTLIVAENGVGNGFTVDLTGGAGPDTFRFTDTGNVKTASKADFAKDLITITDFDKASDTIDVKAMGNTGAAADRDILTGTELANIAAKGSLFEAVQEAALYTGAVTQFSVFVYGGDSYIFNENGGVGTFDSGDGLIKIAGVTDLADFTATNFLVA